MVETLLARVGDYVPIVRLARIADGVGTTAKRIDHIIWIGVIVAVGAAVVQLFNSNMGGSDE